MRSALVALTLIAASLTNVVEAADAPPSTEMPPSRGVDLMELLELAAERLNKRFIVDPRVQAHVLLVNVDPKRLTYSELQSILSVHGLVAAEESNGTVRIVPDANARQLPMPLLKEGKRGPDEEAMVTRVIDPAPLKATELVPILRPLLPQYAHLVGHADTNTLVVVAREGNVRMIESIIREMRERGAAEKKP